MTQRIVALTLSAALAAAATTVPAAAETIKVGVILTYSGPAASLGDEIDKAMRLYMKEHEADLPPGVSVELMPRDDTGPNPRPPSAWRRSSSPATMCNFLTGWCGRPMRCRSRRSRPRRRCP